MSRRFSNFSHVSALAVLLTATSIAVPRPALPPLPPEADPPVEDNPAGDPPVVDPPAPAADAPDIAALQTQLAAQAAELETFRQEAETRRQAALTEQQKAEERAAAAEQANTQKDEQIRKLAILQAVRDVAPGLKMDINMDAIRDLYAAGTFSTVEMKDGEPVNVEAFVKDLAGKKPWIVNAPVQAPEIHAQKGGSDKPGEMTEERRAQIRSKFRMRNNS